MDERIEREKQYHDEFFDHGDRTRTEKFYSVFGPSTGQYEDYLREHGAGKNVLEIGCGDGKWSYAYFLAQQGSRVVGIDISDVAVAQAAERISASATGTIRFLAMNAENLEFPDQMFDLVIGQAVIHHLDLNRAYSEIARVLKPGGSAIFVEPLGGNPLINLYRRLTPKLRTPDEQPLRMKDIHLARRYFHVVNSTSYYFSSLVAAPFYGMSWQPAAVRILNRFDRAIFKLLPFTQRMAWIGVIILKKPSVPDC